MKVNRGRLPHPKGGGANEIHIESYSFDINFLFRILRKNKVTALRPR